MKIEHLLLFITRYALATRANLWLIGAGVFWQLGSVFFWPSIAASAVLLGICATFGSTTEYKQAVLVKNAALRRMTYARRVRGGI